MTAVKTFKIPKYFPYLVGSCMFLLAALLADRFVFAGMGYKISKFTATVELIVHVVILYVEFKIYKNAASETRKVFIWCILFSMCAFCSDIYWYVLTYIHNITKLEVGQKVDLIALMVTIIWLVAGIVFLYKILKYHKLKMFKSLKMIIFILFTNILIILLFVLSIYYTSHIFSTINVSQIIDLSLQTLVFDLVIISLIFVDNVGLMLFLIGIVCLMSGYFFLIYMLVFHIFLSGYGEIVWLGGLLCNLFGLLLMYHNKSYNIQYWIRSGNNVKSQFILWYFGMALISFMLFFILTYTFSVINARVLFGLPLYIMSYSSIVIIFALYIGKRFEKPFAQLTENINNFMSDSNGKTQYHYTSKNDISVDKLNTEFDTEEFNFLQQFITQAFIDRAEKERVAIHEKELLLDAEVSKAKILEVENASKQKIIDEQGKFSQQAKQMMHDITSPISSIDMIIEGESKLLPETSRVGLRNACNRIKDIANNLLNQYSKSGSINNSQTNQEILVSLAILQLVSEKRIAHRDSGINFEVKISDTSYFVFITMDRSAFQRMLSNVIDNSVQALKSKKNGTVIITVGDNSENVIITVEDNGPGMPKHIQEKFKHGEAVTEGKEKGHGIGLTQVKDAVDGAQGKFMVYANNSGTTIGFNFPRGQEPSWLISEIKVLPNDIILILDDDSSIHNAWDNKLSMVLDEYQQITVKHFNHGIEVVNYINQLTAEEKDQIFLLTDHELLNQEMNGLDVILKTQLKRSILVTSYAVDTKIQQQVLHYGVKLLPKELVSHTHIKIAKKIVPSSRTVDMVWVEDQGWYVDELVTRYYSELIVDKYVDPYLFLEEVIQYPKNTRIILDTYYQKEDGTQCIITGYQLADKLHGLGYTNLILCSGDNKDNWDTSRQYLKIIHKENREMMQQLNLI